MAITNAFFHFVNIHQSVYCSIERFFQVVVDNNTFHRLFLGTTCRTKEINPQPPGLKASIASFPILFLRSSGPSRALPGQSFRALAYYPLALNIP
jgi:hypothetical protein